MASVLHCDICNKHDSVKNPIRQFKVKEMKYSWGDKYWQHLDVCRTCLNMLRQAAMEKEKALEAYETEKRNHLIGV